MTDPTMTHDDFQAILADYLEDGAPNALGADQRANADAHLLDCAECAALVADLRKIVTHAASLPDLAPQRDLWAGIDARIGRSYRRLALAASLLAASLLVAVTAGVTYSIASRTPSVNTVAATATTGGTAKNVNHPSAAETFDKEISSLRTIVDQRCTELDTGTVTILEKNLKLIDDAIAESKAALARDPASAFLADRLNHAYDSKLKVLRSVATMPARS